MLDVLWDFGLATNWENIELASCDPVATYL